MAAAHRILRWAAEDSRSKRDYDLRIDSVTISTVRSVKGLDFACMFLAGFDYLMPWSSWDLEEICRLAYVAVTRARTRLLVPWVVESAVIEKILGSGRDSGA